MFPWVWFWAPQWHFPWSGDVAQRIDPDTHWFFQGIEPAAGDASIEEQAFAVATYGRQLGLITEVLIDLAEQAGTTSPAATESVRRLKAIAADIERIKQTRHATQAADLEAQLVVLKERGGADYQRLARRLVPLLGGKP
jgi:hypothetical protein